MRAEITLRWHNYNYTIIHNGDRKVLLITPCMTASPELTMYKVPTISKLMLCGMAERRHKNFDKALLLSYAELVTGYSWWSMASVQALL